MSKKIYLFSLVLLALAFTACSETEEVGRYDNWQARSEAFIDSIANAHANIATRGDLDTIHMVAAGGAPLYFKKKTAVGENGIVEGAKPFYSSTVSVYAKVTNILGDVLQGNFTGADPSIDFTVIESCVVSNESNVSKGFAEALQRMQVGERWEIYVPWRYGFGSSDYSLYRLVETITSSTPSTNVLGYSSLIYDVQLLSIKKQ